MKSVIARKTIIPVFFIFLILIGILFFFNYTYVNNLIKNDRANELSQISDYLLEKTALITAEDDDAFIDEFKEITYSICKSFDVDYICMFEPDTDKNTVAYKSIVYSPLYKSDTSGTKDRFFNGPLSYTLRNDEIKVLNGNDRISFVNYQNKYDISLSAIIRVILPSGTKTLVSIEKEFNAISAKVNRIIRIQAEFVIIVYLLTCMLFYVVIRKYVSKPAGIVSNAMNNFVSNGHQNFSMMDESRNDEFGLINKAFNKMASELDSYVDNLSKQKAEIDIASKIQKGLLPEEKSHYNGCRIRALMKPAKNIGGDLYDYLELDEENTLITIADVSGKGVSAAVFMAATLIILRQFARLKMSPKDILFNTNNELLNKNPLMLFVTAFVGIYNNKKKTFTYSNAGHNNPYILSKGQFKVIDNARGTVMGLFENEQYSQQTIALEPGDSLFLFTDGVTEAVNKNNEFFGMERLEKTLETYSVKQGISLISHIANTLSEYSDGPQQNDDITMLTLTAEDQITVDLKPETTDFVKIKNTIISSGIPHEMKLRLCLAAEEIFVNICSYAFKECTQEKTITFGLKNSDRVEVIFSDNGIPYNPTENDLTDIESYDAEAQTGGLGKIIAFGIADKVSYEFKNGKNILRLIKYTETENDNYKKYRE